MRYSKRRQLTPLALSLSLALLIACGGLGVNLFSIEDDKQLGSELDGQIETSPQEYPILSESNYPEAYAYLRAIRDEILDSGQVDHESDFDWEIHIIEDDTVLNAFAAPGGYLYFYTGLIKYLESEDHFAGVLAHEIAHAAHRHSTDALTREYGTSILLDILLGENADFIAVDIARGLGSLAFSRSAESDSDEQSVIYLAETQYACNGAAGFFEKLLEEGAGSPPEFLSTHPNPDNRVSAINQKAQEIDCDTTPSGNNYEAFKQLLP